MASQQLKFFDELKRRNVIRVGFAYLVIAWVLAQVADLGLESFEAPPWVMKTVLLLLGLGFPLALFLAWAFELTPDGIKREAEIDRNEVTAYRPGRKLDFVIIALLAAALVYFVAEHDWSGEAGRSGAAGPKSIAVLPFDNMSDSQENAFFASGVHEDILTYLSKVADLRVISRTSVRKFADDGDDIKVIAAELGVDHIVEGSVRRAGDRVRVTAQLIDAQTEEHLWADNYDRDLSDVFEIQTAVAQEIVAALQARLSAHERQAINSVPTRNIEAYDKYSQARAIRRGSTYSDAQIAEMEPLLLQAVALDPDFAVAHAMLGSVHTNFYWLGMDRTEERLRLAKLEIDRAFELQPDLPEARAALAEYYYRGFNNYGRALSELQAAFDQFPNNAEILETMGVTQRRLGQWDASIESLKAATQLDPGDLSKRHLLLETMTKAQRWDMASAYADELLAAHPEEPMLKALRANIYVSGYGDVAAANELLADAEIVLDPDYLYVFLLLALIAEDYDRALALIDDYDEMFTAFPSGTRDFAVGWIHNFKGDDDAAREYAARSLEALAPLAARDDVGASRWKLLNAESYVRLGRPEEGLRIAREALALNPLDRDAVDSPDLRENAAKVIALAGDVDAGLDILEELVDRPGGPSSWDLRLDPNWRFLRDNPRFKELAGLGDEM